MDEVEGEGFNFFEVVIVLFEGVKVTRAFVEDFGDPFPDVDFALDGNVFECLAPELGFAENFRTAGNGALGGTESD